MKVTDSDEHSNFLVLAPVDDQLDRDSSKVVEHSPYHSYVKGLSPAATVDVGRNKWQNISSISDYLLSLMLPQQSTNTKSIERALYSNSGWTDMFPQNGLAKPRV